MMPFPEDFREFLKSLNSHNVEYLLIGGYAVAYHGYLRATQDMDVWINATPENAKRAVDALISFGFSAENVSIDMFLENERVIRMGVPPLRIEMLTSISGVTFNECYLEKETVTVDGMDIPLIGRDKLIKNKKASGRLKDLADVESLEG